MHIGLWKYSRHPNHFGEQTWWVGLLLLGYAASKPAALWPICFGVLFNHSLDTLVTLPLIESRMLRNGKRAAAFQKYTLRQPAHANHYCIHALHVLPRARYQRTTSLLVPLPRCADQGKAA